ncbi:MAG: response regulator transcription factor [Leptolyngbyaceae cyanobacterium RM2_2_4]|nr:response regulator transcription factor [Leptolyngbyaceae cyanobacterium RM2_2_4]
MRSDYQILVVDDVEDNLLLLQMFLEAEGYDVETADNGTAAIAKSKLSPRLICLLDVMMPDMNGYEVTRHIRHNQSLSIPIMLVSAHDETNAIEGLELGADDFIRKPIDFDELLTRIKIFIK